MRLRAIAGLLLALAGCTAAGAPAGPASGEPAAGAIPFHPDLAAARAASAQDGKPVLLYFHFER